jgi:hypothetical protein
VCAGCVCGYLVADNLTEEEHEALVKLAKDPNIVITKADKGNAVLIQNVADYKAKVKLVLENPGKFEKLPNDVTITRERKLQNLLRQMNASHEWIADKRVKKCPNAGWRKSERKERLPDEIYKRIAPWGSRAGVMYGWPKFEIPQ